MAAVATLLERESELAELAEAQQSALDGDGRCVVVEGAAGIGKTSLLRVVRRRADAGEATVLSARGTQLEQTLAYGVVRQLFERAVLRSSPVERDEALAGAAAHAAPVLEGRREPLTAPAGADSTFAVLHGLYWLAANLAERRPLILTIDDLHWADSSSLGWLDYLAHRIEGLPVLVVATVRPLEGEAAPALADLLADPATLVIRPSPLTRDAAAALISERISLDSFEGVSDAAHDATAGNPLLLRELAGALAGADGRGDFVAEVQRLAPGVVARRVRLELAKLGSDATALAHAVAVVGDDAVCSACIPQQAGLDQARSDEVATLLARAEVLRADRPLRFVHPLVRQAVYESIAPADRAAAHRRAATLLAEMGAPVDRVAAQLVLAPPAEDPAAVDSLRTAASAAVAAGAPDSAITYLRRATEEPPRQELRGEVLMELAAACGLAGLRETVDHVREAVPLLDDAPRRIEGRRRLARGLFWQGQEEAAVTEIQAALDEAPADDDALRRALEADLFSAALRIPQLHAAAMDRLAALEVGAADDAGALMLLALKAYAGMTVGERCEEVVELAARALVKGLPTEEAPSWSLWGAVSALLHADRYEPAQTVVDQAVVEARRRGAVYMFAGASMVRASIRSTAGELVDAEADARASVEAVPHRGAMLMPLSYGLLAEILVERGQTAEAAAVLTEAGRRRQDRGVVCLDSPPDGAVPPGSRSGRPRSREGRRARLRPRLRGRGLPEPGGCPVALGGGARLNRRGRCLGGAPPGLRGAGAGTRVGDGPGSRAQPAGARPGHGRQGGALAAGGIRRGAGGLAGAARAGAVAGRARLRASAGRKAGGGARIASPGRRAGAALRCRTAGRERSRGAVGEWRQAALVSALGGGVPYAEREAGSRHGGGRHGKPRDRPGPLRDPANRGDAPEQRVPKARDLVAHPARGRARGAAGRVSRRPRRLLRRGRSADERTRTSTSRRTQAPEACASTNSATSA